MKDEIQFWNRRSISVRLVVGMAQSAFYAVDTRSARKYGGRGWGRLWLLFASTHQYFCIFRAGPLE